MRIICYEQTWICRESFLTIDLTKSFAELAIAESFSPLYKDNVREKYRAYSALLRK